MCWLRGRCFDRQENINVHSVREETTDRLIGAVVLTRRGTERLGEGEGAGGLWQSIKYA
jgi:hypothetical protein